MKQIRCLQICNGLAALVALVLGLSIMIPVQAAWGVQINIHDADNGGANQDSKPVPALNAQSGYPPATPTNLMAASDENAPGRVWLTWNSPPHPDGANPITHHEYRYRQPGSGQGWGNWTAIPFSVFGQLNANQFTVTGLTNGVPYQFQLRAVNDDGGSQPSGVARAEAGARFGICDRTRVVRDAIIEKVSEADDCAQLTESDLPAVTGSLVIQNASATLRPGDFDGLRSLTTLDLSRNSLSELPAGIFDDLMSLTSLSLSNNQLTGLPAGVFDGLTSLNLLRLNSNRLTGLPVGVFDELTALQVLNLDDNRLSELTAGVFDKLPSLMEIRLSGNNLTGLPVGILARLPALEVLDLRANRLTALADGIFSGLTNLRALHLEGNTVNPIILSVSLELDEQSRLRAIVPAGAPFDVVLSLGVSNGSVAGGLNTITVPAGALESALLTVIPTVLSLDTTMEIASLPLLPGRHTGYRLENPVKQALVIPRKSNATGAPTLTGTARVGKTLTADTGAIVDADGKTKAENGATGFAYSYRWIRVDSDGVSNATEIGTDRDSYELAAADVGRKIKVQVSYTDDADNAEALISAAYPSIGTIRGGNATGEPVISGTAQVGRALTADTDGILDADGKAMAESGYTGFAYSYQWVRVDSDGVSNATDTGTDRGSYTLEEADAGKKVKVQVTFTDDAGNTEVVTSAAYPSNGVVRGGNVAGATVNSAAAPSAGPPGLSMDDVEIQESPGASLSFTVRLNRVAAEAVTVDYASADGTATAGEDYTAASGTLAFAPGEMEQTIPVAVLDDSHNEGSETLTLTLSNPSGAYLTDATATGTINNSDPLPKGWLARFGRTSAVQVLGLLDARFDEVGAAASQVTLGGRLIRLPGWQSGRWSLWGRGALTHFAGRDREVQIEGDVLTGVLGLDYRTARWLTGVALSWSDGDGRYRSAIDSGALDSHLAGVYPYGRYALTDRLSVWGVLGYGRGGMRLQQAAEGEDTREAVKTGIGMGMGAAGLRGIVYSSEAGELAVKSDALWVRTHSDATDGMAGVAAADASRVRLLLSGVHRHTLWNGGLLTPDVELGLRYDGGAVETGFGMELGGGLRYADPMLGLMLETRARGLIAHEDDSYEEWGLSGSVQLDPGRAGRGLMLRLASGWGMTESGTRAVWERQGRMGPGLQPGGEMGSRFSAEWSYGLDVPWRLGVLTPYGGVDMAGRGRRLRLGWRYELGQSLSLSLDGERRETPHARPQHGLMLRTSLPW